MWLSQLVLLAVLFINCSCSVEFFSGPRYGKRTKEDIEDSHPYLSRDIRSGVFWSGTRYARRGARDSRISEYPTEVKPRSERFFMGTRYGKRTPETKEVTRTPALCNVESFRAICNRIFLDDRFSLT